MPTKHGRRPKTTLRTFFTEKQNFQDDMGAGKSGFESADNVGESRSQQLPFDGRSLGVSTIVCMPILSGDTGRESVRGAMARYKA